MTDENRLPREEIEKIVFQGVLHARTRADQHRAHKKTVRGADG